MQHTSRDETDHRSLTTLTIRDLAAVMRVSSVQTVRDMVARGELPPVSFRVGGRPRWRESDVIDWLAARTAASGREELGSAAREQEAEAKRSLAGGAETRQAEPGASPSTSSDEEGERNAG